ncbi:MAG: hypothetical protein AB1762_06080 [Gemmatimonadota bacterium]
MSNSSGFFPPEFEATKLENVRLLRENRELQAKVQHLEGEIDRLDEYTKHLPSCGIGPNTDCTCGLDEEAHSRACLIHEGRPCNCFIEYPIDGVRDERPDDIPVPQPIDRASLDASISRLEAIRSE